ncbi:hypothetical protein CM19_00435 [Candidatus Acidianus copahuensis]|uniref:Major facilitator superfamily (MFS) profile domain-containing protein n=5 Tax=Acidianus TaxID=12914 RepID=A0A031LTV0_9CREN|nr:MFS transporter [Candidatus Acidianus copahuensis]EZQ11817.1 hypothetical protein CM19_00435 [Candidatus Acidianus copahuensis]
MLSTIGLAGSMFVFTALDALALAIVYLLLPETKGLSLEQIVKLFGEHRVTEIKKYSKKELEKTKPLN